MTGFIGRTSETGFLESAYKDSASALIPLYGRRRVGKSELIRHFIKNKPALYVAGSRAPAAVQIRELLDNAAIVQGHHFLSSLQTRDWKAALQAVVSQWGGPKKLVLALDEFQWMVEASPELPSVLQQLWDQDWKKHGKILLILCGSYIGFMEREVLGGKSPLYGRRTGQIHLKPFSFRESGPFHPAFSIEDKARAYFLTGGVPLYLNFFSRNKSIETNIQDCFLDEYAPLYREAEFLVREELSDVAHFYGILAALAGSGNTVKALSEALNFDSRALPYYLQQLLALGYIRKMYPITGRKPAARFVRYEIADPVLRFWFRFIHPHSSAIVQLGKKTAFTSIIKPDLASYFGACFESLCRESLPVIYGKEGVTADFEIGQYWDKNCQIDVVGYRKDGWTDLGECKWGRTSSLVSLREELEKKVQCYPNARRATVGRRLFTRQSFPKEKFDGLFHHSLVDLYSLDS